MGVILKISCDILTIILTKDNFITKRSKTKKDFDLLLSYKNYHKKFVTHFYEVGKYFVRRS